MVWYTVAGESQQIAQEFEKKYSFVKVEVVRSTVYSLLNRILNEAATGGPLALAAKARNPNAGKLLIDFLLSREGQLHLRKFYRIPSRADLEPISAKLDPKQLQLLPLSPALADKEEEWKKQFRAIFAIQ